MATAERIWRIVEHVPADQLPDLFTDTAADVVRNLVVGEQPEIVTTADYLRMVEAADKLHKMGRLAGGQSTSNAAVSTMTSEERELRLAELRTRLTAMQPDTPTAT